LFEDIRVTHVVLLAVHQIVAYVNADGVTPYAQWHQRLDSAVRARVTAAVYRLEAGNFSAAKGAGAGIFELRLDFGPGYRVYFGKDGEELVILLGGGTKKRQQADIVTAQSMWKEYKLRKEQRREIGTHTKL
jgi:putative addiction module killer protein